MQEVRLHAIICRTEPPRSYLLAIRRYRKTLSAGGAPFVTVVNLAGGLSHLLQYLFRNTNVFLLTRHETESGLSHDAPGSGKEHS
jgi:hypothetical protein